MKRVAFVSQHQVFPTTSGNRQRILNLVRAVRALGCDVSFFFLVQNAGREGFTQELLKEHQAEFGDDRFFLLDCNRSRLTKFLWKVAFFWTTKKFKRSFNPRREHYTDVDYEYFNYYTNGISSLVKDEHFDVVFSEYVFVTRAFEAFDPTVVKVLDTHDSFADRHVKFMHIENPRYWISLDPQEEVQAFRRADVVIAIQETEAEDFRRRLGKAPPEVATVSHIISVPERLADYDRFDAVFVGAQTQPNLVSLTWFMDHVLPLVRAGAPEFRLHVVGSICRAFEDREAVVRHGIIDDLSDAYLLGSITINPTLVGTGINIKLLEAMAAGSPTVATAFGVRGMQEKFCGGVTAVPDEDADQFAAAVLALARDRQLREVEGARARQAALEWNAEQVASLSGIVGSVPAAESMSSCEPVA